MVSKKTSHPLDQPDRTQNEFLAQEINMLEEQPN